MQKSWIHGENSAFFTDLWSALDKPQFGDLSFALNCVRWVSVFHNFHFYNLISITYLALSPAVLVGTAQYHIWERTGSSPIQGCMSVGHWNWRRFREKGREGGYQPQLHPCPCCTLPPRWLSAQHGEISDSWNSSAKPPEKQPGN